MFLEQLVLDPFYLPLFPCNGFVPLRHVIYLAHRDTAADALSMRNCVIEDVTVRVRALRERSRRGDAKLT